jgi:hypothetical protein
MVGSNTSSCRSYELLFFEMPLYGVYYIFHKMKSLAYDNCLAVDIGNCCYSNLLNIQNLTHIFVQWLFQCPFPSILNLCVFRC